VPPSRPPWASPPGHCRGGCRPPWPRRSVALRGGTVYVPSAAFLTGNDPNLLLAHLTRQDPQAQPGGGVYPGGRFQAPEARVVTVAR
jgi:hypothetical protein